MEAEPCDLEPGAAAAVPRAAARVGPPPGAADEVEEDGFSVNTDSRAGGVMETKKKQQTLKAQTPGASLKISSAMLRRLEWD